jgi:hypothetical protein
MGVPVSNCSALAYYPSPRLVGYNIAPKLRQNRFKYSATAVGNGSGITYTQWGVMSRMPPRPGSAMIQGDHRVYLPSSPLGNFCPTCFSPIGPPGWEDIGFNGDYVWPSEPFKDGFRWLRNPRPIPRRRLACVLEQILRWSRRFCAKWALLSKNYWFKNVRSTFV